MPPGGDLILRGAPHLALLPHGGGGQERGGEKRLKGRGGGAGAAETCGAGKRRRSGELLPSGHVCSDDAPAANVAARREGGARFLAPPPLRGKRHKHPSLKRGFHLHLDCEEKEKRG